MPKALSQIRIIGGKFRGRKISFAPVVGLRPTPDRVRETLFNWLMQDIQGAVCLDAFAGSGALGFEALSRGAALVTMLEQSPAAAHQLNNAKLKLGLSNLELINTNSLEYIPKLQQKYDIVFLDPPFNSGLQITVIKLLEQYQIMRDRSLAYVESGSALPPQELPLHWELLKQKTAGQVCYSLYRVHSICIKN